VFVSLFLSSLPAPSTRHAIKAFRFITAEGKEKKEEETKYNKNVRYVFSTNTRPVRQQ
jgi:hypothetical protein